MAADTVISCNTQGTTDNRFLQCTWNSTDCIAGRH